MADSRLDVILSLVDNFSGEAKDVNKTLDDWRDGFEETGKKLTTRVTLPLLAAGGAALWFADEVEASRDKVDMVFGDAADIILEFTEGAAENLRASQADANEYAGLWGQLFQQLGMDAEEAATMTVEQLGLIADAASANNVPFTEMNEAVQSALAGSNISLRRFGLFLNAATVENRALEMSGKDAASELTEEEKALARNVLILEHFDQWAGDAARTNEEFNAQVRIATARAKDLSAEFGKHLIPIAKDLMTHVGNLIGWFEGLDEETKKNIVTVLGIVAAIGPLLLVLAKVMVAVKTLIPLFVGIKTAVVVLTTSGVLPIIAALGLMITAWKGIIDNITRVWEIITGKRSLLDEFRKDWEKITGAVGKFIDGVKGVIDWLGKIKIPAILTGKSPSPFEKSLTGINDALDELAQKRAAILGQAFNPWIGQRMPMMGGAQQNFNLHIHTSAPYEPIIDDFDMMRAMAGA